MSTATLPFVGWCTGPEDLHCDRFLTFDFDAPVYSGDEVVVILRKGAGLSVAGKFLQYRQSDGNWFFTFWSRPSDVGDHSKLHASYFDPQHGLVRNVISVLAVVAIVEDIRQPRGTPRLPFVSGLTAEQLAALYRENRDVVEEWQRDGYPPRRRLEFTNDPQTVAAFTRRCA
jgi:hypothetical protein